MREYKNQKRHEEARKLDKNIGNHKLKVIFHSFGIASLIGSIVIAICVFTQILRTGSFLAKEPNIHVLTFEYAISIFAVLYIGYLYYKLILEGGVYEI